MSAITNMSLYIPHVFANISEDRIIDAFEGQSIGKVKNIDLVGKLGKDGKPYNAVYVHFEYWFDNSVARNFQERVLNPNKEARIVYEDPWFWIVLENKAQKHVSGSRKARIEIPQEVPREVQVTPVKQLTNKDFADMFRAPYKEALKMSAQLDFDDADFKELCHQIHFDDEDDEANMDETEKLMDEEDQHLSCFDRRYVQTLEQENNSYRSRDNVYFECLGRSQHQLSILMDENMCLKYELSLLKDQGIMNPEVYY
jgi:hypothetical protein